jgi:phenylalanine-4-hydroxylase
MKFDKNLYEGMARHPLMMVKKLNENLRALALTERVGENAAWRELLADQYKLCNMLAGRTYLHYDKILNFILD